MKGPIKKIEFDDVSSFDTPTEIPIDATIEEALQFPNDEEATQNNAAGEAGQVSVKTTSAIPIVTEGALFEAELATAAKAKKRLWLRITDADGSVLTHGGSRGCRVRVIRNGDLGYGKQATAVFKFEVTGGDTFATQKRSYVQPGTGGASGAGGAGVGAGLL